MRSEKLSSLLNDAKNRLDVHIMSMVLAEIHGIFTEYKTTFYGFHRYILPLKMKAIPIIFALSPPNFDQDAY